MDGLLEVAKPFLLQKSWGSELVLKLGAHLAEAANRVGNLSGVEKSELVCRTILQILDDAQKADEERKKESTDPDYSSPNWEALRGLVTTVLPTTLTLIVNAARGKFDLQKKSLVAAAEAAAPLALQAASDAFAGKSSWLNSCLGCIAAVVLPVPPLPTPTQPQPVVAEPPKELENRPAAEAVPGSADPASSVLQPKTS